MSFTYYSQDAQDRFLHEHVFHHFRNGYFVDVGAYDGKNINNTLFYENTYGWTGMNFEPLPPIYARLIKNRPKCLNFNFAINDKEGEFDFYNNTQMTTMLSGLVVHYDPRHKNRLDQANADDHNATSLIRVRARPLRDIFEEHKVKRVNYLSIDVEGAEKAVLDSIDFDKVFIDVIGFENNYNDSATENIKKMLESKGFNYIDFRNTDVFMINKRSPFQYTP